MTGNDADNGLFRNMNNDWSRVTGVQARQNDYFFPVGTYTAHLRLTPVYYH